MTTKSVRTIGDRVLQLREHHRMSRSELAELMHQRVGRWHKETARRVEHDMQPLRADDALHLAEIMGTSVAWIITGKHADKSTYNAGYEDGHHTGMRFAFEQITNLKNTLTKGTP